MYTMTDKGVLFMEVSSFLGCPYGGVPLYILCQLVHGVLLYIVRIQDLSDAAIAKFDEGQVREALEMATRFLVPSLKSMSETRCLEDDGVMAKVREDWCNCLTHPSLSSGESYKSQSRLFIDRLNFHQMSVVESGSQATFRLKHACGVILIACQRMPYKSQIIMKKQWGKQSEDLRLCL